MTSDTPRVLVVGAGGIGGLVAGSLAEIGADVTAVTTNPGILAAVRDRGFRLREEGEDRAVPGRIEAAPPEGERFDVVVLATQPPSVEDAARTALPTLADDGAMVVLQNGLCEARVARIVGPERVVGGIVAWGASMPEPGLYERTAAGGFTLGRIGGDPDDTVRRIGALLEAVGPVTTTANLMGARWSKLAINCAISSLATIAGERLGPLVRVRRYRRLALEVMSEAVEVARREDVRLEKVAGTLDLDWVALTDAERAAKVGSAGLTAKHALLIAVGLRYRRMRSSMLAAIERGRTPAIDFLNGEVVAHAATHGVEVPVNTLVVERVWQLARGERTPGRAVLDELYEATR
ncbi:MAG: 2-dehydropantoate 2-reductase [Kofleriaceae bacterium]|nr:2-dehydropantoate 2-reductase [Myxococcales bacterium]MCB9561134.1 2-dehydropantoate 2-reductase [Kofleriaceae bacterium]MCB9571331.1 2-dehydropantoate 2-reductase [Kofleriaceae bacterium]